MSAIIENAVKGILPEVVGEAEKLLLRFSKTADGLLGGVLDVPPFVEALIAQALEFLVKRGTLTITTDGQITLVGHTGPHPDDA